MSNSIVTSGRALRLLEIAERIELACHEVGDEGVALIRVANLVGPVELALLPVSYVDLVSTLVETVPEHWAASGVVLSGHAKRFGGQAEAVERLGLARTVVLCDRHGTFTSVIRVAGDAPTSRIENSLDGPHGKIADALRRSMGLPTAPATVPIRHFLALLWVHRIYTLAATGTEVTVQVIEGAQPTRWLSWHQVHQACLAGELPELGISKRIASWMDVGIFSRWCLANFPELSDLLNDLAEIVPSATYSHLQLQLLRI